MTVEPGDRVVVTGASGFVGSALTRALLGRGANVVAALQPGGQHGNIEGLEVERVIADLRDPVAVRRAFEGCRFAFHAGAVYRFWARNRSEFYDVNVGGTLNVLEAAARAGTERIVYTSTVGTIGLAGTAGGRPADETSYADVAHLFGLYKQSKYVAEHEVLRAAAGGAPVVLVQPTTPLGPRDHSPTPSGRIVLDFLEGRLPGYVETDLNVVDVDDVADGHVLAAERGAVGRSYILGGENISFRRLLDLLAECTGLPATERRVPRPLALSAAVVSEVVEGRVLRRPPRVPLEGARMTATRMIFDDSRARRELGYTSRPAREAVERSARWFVEHGYVRPERARRTVLAASAR